MKMSTQLFIKAQIAEALESMSKACQKEFDSITDKIADYNHHKMSIEEEEEFDPLEMKENARFQNDFIEVIARLLDFINTMDLGRD